MTDAERVLSLLLHDLRTPLGVAHGYLRLIRDDRLPRPEDHEKAMTGTQQALSRISRLCADASAFVADADGTAMTAEDTQARAPAAQFVDRVAETLTTQGVEVSVGPPPAAQVAVGSSLDRVADAVATLLMTKAKPASGAVVRIDAEAGSLRFTSVPARPAAANEPGVGAAAASGSDRPFDPWQSGQGLSVALAHRVVIRVGGRVWITDGARAIAMTVPMENGTA
jgi:light-regulated signal transduction histidine kinase (bacteriophytochrome)